MDGAQFHPPWVGNIGGEPGRDKMEGPDDRRLAFVVSHSSSKKALDEWGTLHLWGIRSFIFSSAVEGNGRLEVAGLC
jgi:hypothetical protein